MLPARVRGYRREWLDELTLSGEVAWGRLWGSAASSVRNDAHLPRAARRARGEWTSLSKPPDVAALTGAAREITRPLLTRGAMFPQELGRAARLLAAAARRWAGRARGARARDLRFVRRAPHAARPCVAPSRAGSGGGAVELAPARGARAAPVELVARQLLTPHRRRLSDAPFRARSSPFPGAICCACCARIEARGEVRGGRFVAGFDGEQYALPEAVSLLRAVRRRAPGGPTHASAADPLNYRGILTPDERVSPLARKRVLVA